MAMRNSTAGVAATTVVVAVIVAVAVAAIRTAIRDRRARIRTRVGAGRVLVRGSGDRNPIHHIAEHISTCTCRALVCLPSLHITVTPRHRVGKLALLVCNVLWNF